MPFTVEETNLMSIYHTGTRLSLISEMTAALPYMDKNFQELARRIIKKLHSMSEDDFFRLSITPADDE